MLLELARDGPIDGPVPRVVGAHGKLVDEDAFVRALSHDEHFHGKDAGDAQLVRDALADTARLGDRLGSDADGGGHDLGAHAVNLHGGGDGPRGDLTRGGAREECRHLPGEGNQGLGQ